MFKNKNQNAIFIIQVRSLMFVLVTQFDLKPISDYEVKFMINMTIFYIMVKWG